MTGGGAGSAQRRCILRRRPIPSTLNKRPGSLHAEVAKLADAPDLGSGGAIRRGSSPLFRTKTSSSQHFQQDQNHEPDHHPARQHPHHPAQIPPTTATPTPTASRSASRSGTSTSSSARSSSRRREDVDIQNFQGIYLSPQQAKALYNVLTPQPRPVRADLRPHLPRNPQHPGAPRFVVPSGPVH